jgi:tetratricopeptide (TPR) repeat protein
MTPSRKLRMLFLAIGPISLFGCASRQPAAPSVSVKSSLTRTAAATRPADAKAAMTLEAILPKAALPAAATQPSTPVPLDALQTYAQARAALVDSQRFKAILLLQRAASLDPHSFDVQFDLGKAYLATSAGSAASASCVAALEKAADIQPNHLEVQYELGRQYLNRGDAAKAMQRLRWAQLTIDYRDSVHPDLQVMTDFFLGRALSEGTSLRRWGSTRDC